MGYKLTDVVNELLAEMGEGQTNKFARFYQFGVSGLRKFNMNSIGVPKAVELVIDSNDTAPLPNDYMQYTRIALCSGGKLYCLGLNENLCINPAFNNCGDEVSHPDNAYLWNGYLGNPLIADNFRNGEMMGRMFGIGGDNNFLGYYRIDTANNRIVFQDLLQTSSVVLEYLADIDAIDGDFEVHPFCIEALKDWMFWKYKQRSSKPLGEQSMAEQSFRNSSRLMRMAFASNTKEEWVAAFQTGNKASTKM